jgi:hypothetical protein
MSEHVEELFLTKRLFHDFYSRPKIKRTGKMEDNAKPMHKKKKKKKKTYARFSQQKWPVLTGFDFGWMHNFFLSQIKPKGYLKQQ